MGQINLFASTLSDTMKEFINGNGTTTGYLDGKLWKVSLSRVLDERLFPHAYAIEDTLEYNYVMVEVVDPLTWDDITWLYKCIVTEEWEFNKSSAWRYSIERTLNAPGARQLRRKVESDAEWVRVKEFRRILEAPALAFQHFNRFYQKDTTQGPGHLQVTKSGKVLLIEYAAQSVREHAVEGDVISLDSEAEAMVIRHREETAH